MKRRCSKEDKDIVEAVAFPEIKTEKRLVLGCRGCGRLFESRDAFEKHLQEQAKSTG